jgi:hypothetical protein
MLKRRYSAKIAFLVDTLELFSPRLPDTRPQVKGAASVDVPHKKACPEVAFVLT